MNAITQMRLPNARNRLFDEHSSSGGLGFVIDDSIVIVNVIDDDDDSSMKTKIRSEICLTRWRNCKGQNQLFSPLSLSLPPRTRGLSGPVHHGVHEGRNVFPRRGCRCAVHGLFQIPRSAPTGNHAGRLCASHGDRSHRPFEHRHGGQRHARALRWIEIPHVPSRAQSNSRSTASVSGQSLASTMSWPC